MKPPMAGVKGSNRRHQSLAGFYCWSCKVGEYDLRPDGTNVCRHCGAEAITEWEAQRREKATAALAGR